MIFSRLLPLFALALSFNFMSVAKPVAEAGVLAKRAAAGIDVAKMLQHQPQGRDQFYALVDSGNENGGNIERLYDHLLDAFEAATAALTKVKGIATQSGPAEAEVAPLIASIVTDVATTMQKTPVDAIWVLDLTMKNFLESVERDLGGTLPVLAGLLSGKGFLVTGYVGLS